LSRGQLSSCRATKMAPSLHVKTNSEQTWLFLFIPALLYYIYSCNNPNDTYNNAPPTSSCNSNDATTCSSTSSGRTGILSSLQLSQSYRVVASSVKLAGGDVRLSEIEPFFRLASLVDNKDDENHREWSLTYPLEAVIGLQPHPLHRPTTAPSSSSPSDLSNQEGDPKHFFTSSVWVHDEELGRGYLLLSDSLHSGTVWRWEVGGGPITIGRSLYLKDSGCRSRIWADCPLPRPLPRPGGDDSTPSTPTTVRLGSAGITIQSPKDSDHFQSGSLIVVEKGEKRIVRMELDGARTPLVLQVPPLFLSDEEKEEEEATTTEQPESRTTTNASTGTTATTTRLNDPGLLLYTPFGDLIFTDRKTICTTDDDDDDDDSCGSTGGAVVIAGVYRMSEVVNIPPLSFQSSRKAHEWTHVEEDTAATMAAAASAGDGGTVNRDTEAGVGAGAGIEILYNDGLESVTGLTLGSDLNTVFIAGRKAIVTDGDGDGGGGECRRTRQYIIVKSSLDDEEEDEEDPIITKNQSHKGDKAAEQEQRKTKQRVPGLLDTKSTLFYDMTHLFSYDNDNGDNDVGPAVVVDKSGNVYATFPGGVAIIDSNAELLATIPFDAETTSTHLRNDGGEEKKENDKGDTGTAVIVPNSITFGHDGYLYITSKDALMRMRVKSLPMETPTNMIVPPKKKVHMYTA